MPPQVKMGNVAGNFLQGLAQARKRQSQQQRRQALNELAQERAQKIRQQRQEQQALAGLSQRYLNQPSQFGLGTGGPQGDGIKGVSGGQRTTAGRSLQALAALDPRRAAQLQKIRQQQVANQAQQEIQLLRQVNDQESYARAKRQAEQAGIVQPGQLPDQYPGDEWRDRNLQEDMEALRQVGAVEQPDRSTAGQEYRELIRQGVSREEALRATYGVGEDQGEDRLKPSHENAIRRMAVDFLGGAVDPRTGQIRGLDATKQRELLRLESQASQIYKRGEAPTLARAVEMAANSMGIPTREPESAQEKKPEQEADTETGGGLGEKVMGAYETVRDYFAGEEGEEQGEEEDKTRAEPQSRGDDVVLTDHPRFGDVTEDQIQFTMERHDISRRELIRRLKEQGAKEPQRNRQVTPSAP